MSRIGRKPIAIPAGVQVSVDEDNVVTVKGPLGTLTKAFHPNMMIKVDGSVVTVSRPDDEKLNRSLHGMTRTMIYNMIVGVTQGYSKSLEIVGVGYRAQKQGKQCVMTLGYSHKVVVDDTDDITIEVPSPNTIVVKGCDKQKVGQTAAEIREAKLPDVYKGMGIRYTGEVIHLKAGKTGAKKK